MKPRHAAALVLVIAPLLAPPSFAQSDTKTFTAPDGSFSFRYWTGLVQCKPPKDGGEVWEPHDVCSAYNPVCDQEIVGSAGDSPWNELHAVACFAYPKNEFTNTPVFEAATFSVEVLGINKTVKSCLTPDNAGLQHTGTTTINGIVFTTFDFYSTGMNQGIAGTVYRSFHKGKCYQLGTNQATANKEIFDPSVRDFTDRDSDQVGTKLDQPLKSFRFLK